MPGWHRVGGGDSDQHFPHRPDQGPAQVVSTDETADLSEAFALFERGGYA